MAYEYELNCFACGRCRRFINASFKNANHIRVLYFVIYLSHLTWNLCQPYDNCVNILKVNYMSAWKLYMVLYSFYLCSPWSPLQSITPEICAMSCLLLEVTCYDYIKKLSIIKSKLGPCHMYWGVLFSVETDITRAVYNIEITVE